MNEESGLHTPRQGARAKNPRAIATVALSGTLEDKLAAIARAGFDGVEVFENDLIVCPLSPEEVARRAADLGLALYLYQPFRDFEGVKPERQVANLRRAEEKFAVMRRLGTTAMLVCSNVQADAINDDALAAEQLCVLADRAREQGFVIAYEALAWGTHVNRFEQAWKIVQLAGHPNLGVALDSFHALSISSDVTAMVSIPAEKIAFVQLADAPWLQMDVLQWSRHHRCFPGQGRLDVAGFVRTLLGTGYAGPISLEVFNDIFRQADPDRIAVDGMRSLVALEERVKHHLAKPRITSATPTSMAGASPTYPALAPCLGGYAFVEIAVDSVALPALEKLMVAMGFERRGVHRSKSVSLWQQGAAVVLINTDPRPLHQPAWPTLSALALESEDPALSADRALALLATEVPRHRGPAEAALTAIAAPDGTAVFFCRTAEDEADNWRGDFDETRTSRRDRSTSLGDLDIDHVALSQPLESFDEAVLFYESITGLERESTEELATPRGLLRSSAMVNRERTVRLALNAPMLGRGAATGFLPQHIAFRTTDVTRAGRLATANGLSILPVPQNYYDDLRSRYELSKELVEHLRSSHLLYDRDARGGELLHFYTVATGRGLFFEFLERRGGYSGYGAANAPVRAAAQFRLDHQTGMTALAWNEPGRSVALPA